MGGKGSFVPSKKTKEIRNKIKERIRGGGAGGGGLPSSGGSDITLEDISFPIECEDGSIIEADFDDATIVVIKNGKSVTITFEEWEKEYVKKYGYDFCLAVNDLID